MTLEQFRNHIDQARGLLQRHRAQDTEPVHVIAAMIRDALDQSELAIPAASDSPDQAPHRIRVKDVVLTLKAAAVHDAGGKLNFSIFGFKGDLGASVGSSDTHTIEVTFDAGSNFAPGETKVEPQRQDDDQDDAKDNKSFNNEFIDAFKQLRTILSTDDSKIVVKSATVDLDFVVDKNFNVALVATGETKSTSTHTVHLVFEAGDGE